MTDEQKHIYEPVEVRPKQVPIKCPVCNGFGTLNWGKKKCQACEGKGYVLVEAEEKK